MPEIRQLLSADDAVAGDEARRASGSAPAPPARAVVQYVDEHCQGCTSPDDHDEWNAGARGETPLQRVDRAYGEILQEVRVAQTGVQILFAFLLTLAFTSRFPQVTQVERYIYVTTLMLCAAATALLIAPAAFHRVIYRRRLKHHLVHVANRLALSGLVLLLLAMISALLLILEVVIGLGPAVLLAVGGLAWFVTWWFVLPVWSRIRHQSRTDRRGALDEDLAPGHRPDPPPTLGHPQVPDRLGGTRSR
jgi:Family of unknown function (DUF6328)